MSLFANVPTSPAPSVAEDAEAAYRSALLAATPLPGFFEALVDELFAVAAADNAASFLRQVGRRMAGALTLPASETLEALAAAMNGRLLAARWGWVELAEVENGIRIRHGALPVAGTGASAQGVAALLEGLYSAWLAQAGGGEHLQARYRAVVEGGQIELLYGR